MSRKEVYFKLMKMGSKNEKFLKSGYFTLKLKIGILLNCRLGFQSSASQRFPTQKLSLRISLINKIMTNKGGRAASIHCHLSLVEVLSLQHNSTGTSAVVCRRSHPSTSRHLV